MEQKRHVFFKFVELFHDKVFPQDLKAKALQFVIIPMFAASFDKGEGEKVQIIKSLLFQFLIIPMLIYDLPLGIFSVPVFV